MCSKARSAVRVPGRSPGLRRGLSCCFGLSSDTAPSLSALLGWYAEAEPSGATSAARYDAAKRVFRVPHVVAIRELVNVERQVALGHLMEGADDAALQ
jgi:hypothetical protein